MASSASESAAAGVGLSVTEAEWRSRVECAAGHHLLERYRLTDMVEGVLGLRVEDEAEYEGLDLALHAEAAYTTTASGSPVSR